MKCAVVENESGIRVADMKELIINSAKFSYYFMRYKCRNIEGNITYIGEGDTGFIHV